MVVEITKEKKSKKSLPRVDIKSTYSVEDSAMMQSLEKNITTAIKVGKQVKKGKYICSVAFIIAKDGYVSDVRCEIDSGFGICEEVVRQIKKSPRWSPAEPIKVKSIE
jgi:periplasmic protein TonB